MEKKNQHRLFYMNSTLFDYKRSVYINKICLQFFQSNKTIIASRIINLTQEITIDARFNMLNLNELHLQQHSYSETFQNFSTGLIQYKLEAVLDIYKKTFYPSCLTSCRTQDLKSQEIRKYWKILKYWRKQSVVRSLPTSNKTLVLVVKN